ncbi:MAG TPA: hypothetical protein VF918_16770 [Anaerolineales bacterium]
MLTKHAKFIMGACLLLSVWACASIKTIASEAEDSAGQLPRRKLVIKIETSQPNKLFDQLRKFADEQGFKILIDTRPPGVEGFYIDMYRRDIEISGTNPFAPEEYQIGIYDADRQHPVSEWVLDDLVNDLKSFISEVPNVTITEEK